MARYAQPAPGGRDAQALLAGLLATPPDGDDAEALLAALLASAPGERVRAPARAAVGEAPLDRALRWGARLSGVTALALCGYWFVDGPLRDWSYAQSSPPPIRPQSAQLAAHISGLQLSPGAPAPRAATSRLFIPMLARSAPYGPAGSYAPPPAVLAPQADSSGAPPPMLLVSQARGSGAPAPAEAAAPPLASVPRPVAAAEEPSWLTIPALGVDTKVVNTYFADGTWQTADYAAGYLHGTGVPGEVGNTVLSGHAGLRGAVFQGLGALRPGDLVYVERPGWRFVYKVRGQQVVWPTQFEVTMPTETAVLTLITCTNWDVQRLVVTADLVGGEPLP